MIKFYAEIARKTIHLSSLWIPFLYLYSTQKTMLLILLPLTFLVLVIDISRRFLPALNYIVTKLFDYMMRQKEKEDFAFSGATYMLCAASLTISLFSQEVAIFALTILMISDSCAALIGRKFGRINLMDKTLEGSLSFIFSAILIYFFYRVFYQFSLPLSIALLAIFMASIVELFTKKIYIDDNFTIPLTIGLVFWLF